MAVLLALFAGHVDAAVGGGLRNFDGDVGVLDAGLAAEAAGGLHVLGEVELVELVVLGLGQGVEALRDVAVAGRAGRAAAAG